MSTRVRPRKAIAAAVAQQAKTLDEIADLFKKQSLSLLEDGPALDDASVGPAAATEDPSAEDDATNDDIAERLEWVTEDWIAPFKSFLNVHVGDGAGEMFFELYEVHNYNHAAELLITAYKNEFSELAEALLGFRIKKRWITEAGGNESPIPQALQAMLYPKCWYETSLKGHLVYETHTAEKTQRTKKGIGLFQPKSGFPKYQKTLRVKPVLRQLVVDAHKIDHVKGMVAFDMEWNSKDQTFDRDLYAMRLFHEAHLIGAGVLLTRSKELNPIVKDLLAASGISSTKYGASTTWMGKLLYRLRSSRSGGCPVLALGIRPACLAD